MKNKFNILIVFFLLIVTLACNTLAKPLAGVSATPTQETTLQSTTVPMLAETPLESPPSLDAASAEIYNSNMILVPEGEFTMGTDNSNEEFGPSHKVYLDAYYIDKYEVTNVQYRACVEAGVCVALLDTGSHTRKNYFGNSEFDDYPVIHVDWNMAKSFCEWRGASLPTEAQWEKATRGTDGRTYPWGEEEPSDETFGNFRYVGYTELPETISGDTVPVGSYEKGVSVFGIHDLNGNVFEWVADWFSVSYYQTSPLSNPLGPDKGECSRYGSGGSYFEEGDCKVIRGGSWSTGANNIYRVASELSDTSNDTGFRCVRKP